MTDSIRFDDRVVVITGAGGGLGRAYALDFAKRGAKVVVNDLGGSGAGEGASSSAADQVVQEIVDAGGDAVANYDSVENGEAIIQTAIDNYNRVDVLINNAGILRDASFAKMTDEAWQQIHKVHLDGAYSVTKAAWPHMLAAGYGRIIFTTSAAGIYGNFGQSNYSSAKSGLMGLGRTLAVEGARKNVLSNIVAPIAGSRLTETIWSEKILKATSPDYVVPLIVKLCAEQNQENGGVFEAGANWFSKVRLQRSEGIHFGLDETVSAEQIEQQWGKLCDFEGAKEVKDVYSTFTKVSELIGINLLDPGS